MRPAIALLFLLGFAACVPPATLHNPGPTTITYKVDDREAYARILRSIVAVDLSVELKDVDAGIVKTEWHAFDFEHVGCLGVGVIRRRVRYTIVAAHGECSIKGESAQSFVGGTAGPSPFIEERGLTDSEERLLSSLAEQIKADLEK